MSSGIDYKEFGSIIEHAKAVLWRASADSFQFTFVSKEAEELLGYPAEQWTSDTDFWPKHIYHEDREWAVDFCLKSTKENKAHQFEYRMVAADGRLVWVRDIVRIVIREGVAKELVGVIIDITERKQIEQALIESEERYRNLFENASDIIYTHDLDGNITSFNKAAERLTGYTREEGLNLNLAQVVAPEHLQLARQMTNRKLAGRETPAYELDIIAKDGRRIRVELNASLICKDGIAVGVQGVARDITARKKAEAEMSQALSLLEATLESTADGILVVNNNGRIERYNRKFVEMWGIPQEVLASRDDDRALAHVLAQVKDKEAFVAKIKELYVQADSESYDVIEFIDGRVFERYSQPQRIKGRSVGRVWSFRDVTERRRAELERARMLELEQAARHEAEHVSLLRHEMFEREEKARREWQATFDAMTDAIVIVDTSDRLLRANRAFYEKFDLTPDESIGQFLKEIVHKNDLSALASCPICSVRLSGKRTAMEFPPGAITGYPVFISVAPITDDAGKTVAMVQVIRDLTDLHAAREMAERERISLNATIEQMAEGFVVFDSTANIVRANRQAQKILGFSIELLTAPNSMKNAEGRFTTEEGEVIALDDMPAIVALREERTVNRAMWYTRPDGQKLLLAVTVSPFFDNRSRVMGAVTLVRDVTERKREREQLQQAEKLRALGQLASGVAHNFNNALAAVIGYAQLALPKVKDPEIEKYLRVIEQSAKDAARMVERIQTFSRASSRREYMAPIRLSDIALDAIAITRPRWRHDAESRGINYNINIEWQADEDAIINGEPSELREVFVNIIMNALDAMPEGGQLSIASSSDESSLTVSLADTGAGMSEVVKQRIFEPFFTTKGVAGLGMGLSESYRIIERHGGRIEVESRPGCGATFTIKLPLARAIDNVRPQSDEQAGIKQARVLVIEDEEFVRNVLAAILVEQGHAVQEAPSAEEGLAMLEQNNFDIVFTDLAMPGADGIAAACGIKARSPETKVVLMSGYGVDKALELADSSGAVDAAISKPFHRNEICKTIRKLLEK